MSESESRICASSAMKELVPKKKEKKMKDFGGVAVVWL